MIPTRHPFDEYTDSYWLPVSVFENQPPAPFSGRAPASRARGSLGVALRVDECITGWGLS